MDIQKLIEDAHEGIEYGTTYVVLKKFGGRVADIDIQNMQSTKVTDSADALSRIVSIMKSMKDKKQLGSQTFTVLFNKEGEAHMVIVQDMKRHPIDI